MASRKRRSPSFNRKLTRWYRFVGFAIIFLIGVLDIKVKGSPFLSFVQAVGVLALIILLVNSPGKTLKTIAHWLKCKIKKPEHEKVKLRDSSWVLIRGGISVLAMGFLMAWLIPWLKQLGFGNFREEMLLRPRTFLHAGLFMSFISIALSSRRLKLIIKFLDLTPGRVGFFTYGISAFVGTFILILPVSLNPDASVNLIDALFLSFSALTVTGLVPVNVAETFSIFGQSVLLLMIQIGGLGIVAISFGLVRLIRNQMSLSQSLMGREIYDLPHIGKMGKFIQNVILFTLIAETIAAVWIYFSLPADLEHRLFHAIFQSVSAFCNAGFSSFQDNLAIPGMTSMKIAVAVFVVLGGIGFPVLFELSGQLTSGRKFKRLTSASYLVILVSGVLLVLGSIGIFVIEGMESEQELGFLERVGHAMFYSVSARTAGFHVSDVATLTFGSQLLIAFLMIIGGSPLSTAGGVKTTTFGVILATAYSLMRGHKWVQFHQGEISALVLQKCITVIFLYIVILFVSIFFLATIEPLNPWALTFEAISALSTVGFSLGVTDQLGSISKLIVIGLMIAGRLGLVTIVYIGIGRLTIQKFRYPQEHYYVG